MSDEDAPLLIFPMDDGPPIVARPAGKFLADWRLDRAVNKQLQAELEEARKPTYKEVYARYRRRHAKNPKVTIREVCEEMGVDYDNIRAAKSRATKRENAPKKRHKQGGK